MGDVGVKAGWIYSLWVEDTKGLEKVQLLNITFGTLFESIWEQNVQVLSNSHKKHHLDKNVKLYDTCHFHRLHLSLLFPECPSTCFSFLSLTFCTLFTISSAQNDLPLTISVILLLTSSSSTSPASHFFVVHRQSWRSSLRRKRPRLLSR